MRSSLDRFRYLFVFAALLGTVALVAGQDGTKKEPERCFLWKISSKTTTIYLHGSMHVAKPDMFPLPKEIEDAYASSKNLVVEVNTETLDQAKLQKLALQKGMYPAGQSLSKSLSKKTMDLLEEYAGKKKMKTAALDPFRPWLLNLVLTVEEIKSLGMSAEGVDKHFLKKAKAENKPIVELETAEAQLDLFAELTPELQEKLLAKGLAEMGELKNVLEKMITVWKAGDAKAMEVTMGDPLKRFPEYKAVMVKIFDDRNVKMVDKIDGLLKGKESCFVVVGAGHLVGSKGIVKLLEDKQYKVEQVLRAPAKK